MDRVPDDTAPHDAAAPSEPTSDLTLSEAAVRYAVSARTLAQHIRCGQLPAYKAAGAAGRQWRVTPADLTSAGYPLRTVATDDAPAEDPLVAELRRERNAALRTAAAERRRAEDLDRRLGHAMLEAGRLRAALAAATGEATTRTVDLEPRSARSLVSAAREDQQPFE